MIPPVLLSGVSSALALYRYRHHTGTGFISPPVSVSESRGHQGFSGHQPAWRATGRQSSTRSDLGSTTHSGCRTSHMGSGMFFVTESKITKLGGTLSPLDYLL